MIDDYQQRSISFEEYTRFSANEKVKYLEARVMSGECFTEQFCVQALEQEENAMAQWFLIRSAGIKRYKNAIPHIVKICVNPDISFEGQGGKSTSLHLIGARALGQIGTDCIPKLLELLEDNKTWIRRFAVDTLGEIGVGDPAVLEALAKSLQEDDDEVAIWAALSLAKLGTISLPVLQAGLQSKDLRRIAYTLDAIVKVGGKEAASIASGFLEDADTELREFYTQLVEQQDTLSFNNRDSAQ